ncbi:MAG: hypothetical protein ACQER7_05070 [Bacteroidota bacterium]
MNQMKFPGILFILVFIIAGCQEQNNNDKKPIAKIHDKHLYPSDLKGVIPEDKSEEDSSLIAKNYIDKWIKKQLLLEKAEKNLPEEQKDISKEIQEYRASLLIYRYQQELIDQKLDTVISNEEIENYYDENSSNFVLDKNLAKILYIKLPVNSPNIENVRRWYRSDEEEDLDKLIDYCYQYADKFDDFDNQWIDFGSFIKNLPLEVSQPQRFFRNNKYIEERDGDILHFIRINDYTVRGSQAPMNYVRDKIENIIINKRKHQLLKRLENDIYNQALNHNEFVIY